MELFVAKNGQQAGPFSEMQVREQLRTGEIRATDLAWQAGMAEWQPLHTVITLETAPAGLALVPVLAPPPPMQMVYGAPVGLYPGPPLAGRGSRLGARLLNNLLFFASLLPGGLLLGLTVRDSDKDLPQLIIGIALLAIGALTVIGIQCFLLATRGQSVGKRIVGVKIVTFKDNQNPGFVKVVLLRTIVPLIIGFIPSVGSLFGLVDACCIFREDRRCVHDLMAETKVVEAYASEVFPLPAQER